MRVNRESKRITREGKEFSWEEREAIVKEYFHFLLHAQKKTKQKKKAPATKPIFPSKRAIQPLQAACPRASNVPRCSWMSALHTPLEFFNVALPKVGSW